MRCAMTGLPMRDTSEGIYDDGEWISWDWINGQLHAQELREQYPLAPPEHIEVCEQLVDAAARYREITGPQRRCRPSPRPF